MNSQVRWGHLALIGRLWRPLPGFNSRFCYLLTGRSWASYSTSLGLSFPACSGPARHCSGIPWGSANGSASLLFSGAIIGDFFTFVFHTRPVSWSQHFPLIHLFFSAPAALSWGICHPLATLQTSPTLLPASSVSPSSSSNNRTHTVVYSFESIFPNRFFPIILNHHQDVPYPNQPRGMFLVSLLLPWLWSTAFDSELVLL